MKKNILIIVGLLFVGFFFSTCKKDKIPIIPLDPVPVDTLSPEGVGDVNGPIKLYGNSSYLIVYVNNQFVPGYDPDDVGAYKWFRYRFSAAGSYSVATQLPTGYDDWGHFIVDVDSVSEFGVECYYGTGSNSANLSTSVYYYPANNTARFNVLETEP